MPRSSAPRDLVAGLDIGGTKTHLRIVDRHRTVLHDHVFPSDGWSATPVGPAARWVRHHLDEALAGLEGRLSAVAVGAQGCEQPAHCEELRAALEAGLRVPATVVNDAELLLPAAGLDHGITVIVGTGSIAVTTDTDGTMLRAGGWGWVLSDDGSASALVRDAARAVLDGADRGEPLGTLGELLLASVSVPDVAALAHTLSWGNGPEHWGRHAPAVVAAAERGSPAAQRVLADGARSVAALVRTLGRRGVDVHDVVFAGGLVTNVPAYWSAIRTRLEAAHPDCRPLLLDRPPVTGAVALALRARPERGPGAAAAGRTEQPEDEQRRHGAGAQ
ncbi:N-acetylglucosamine kinase [Kitasatospora sp. NPDC057223]|uniref:N-acetylglucosamine kinase n=1 Tax=Kitasatospora sp. NPDC057223 TaxID=3346055 RepID=UPI0036432B18